MDQFVFSDLQIALDRRRPTQVPQPSDGEQATQTNEDGARARIPCWCSPAASPPTSGVHYTDENNQQQTVLIPRATAEAQAAYEAGKDSGAKKPAPVSRHQLRRGEQALGQRHPDLWRVRFYRRSRLEAVGSFQNIGDVGLRGSEANPITVKLMLNTAAAIGHPGHLEINENIPAGQTVSLVGTCDPLTQDLPRAASSTSTCRRTRNTLKMMHSAAVLARS